MKLSEIAARLGAQLRGDGEIEIHRLIGIEQAGAGDLTFVANKKYISHLKQCAASAVILGHDAPEVGIASLRCDNPYLAFAQSIELFYAKPSPAPGIHPTALISDSAIIGCDPSIGAYAVIDKNVVIGDQVTIYPHVTIYPGARIGNDVVLHSRVVIREEVLLGDRVVVQNGAVIGADGFGFARKDDGSYYKIVQSGTVIVEDDVEIGANSTIDRATIGQTIIRKGAKLDNLVQVGHGSVVGEGNLLAAQVGLAGSTILGKNVILAGQVGVAGHLSLGDNVIATAQTGIPNSVEAGTKVSGYPAIENMQWLKSSAIFARLPELVRRIRALEQALASSSRRSDPDSSGS